MTESQNSYVENPQEIFILWKGTSLKEMFRMEPYLVLSVAFVLLRALLYFFPGIVSRAMALWAAYVPHLNMGIFGESRQLLGHVLHVIDLKRVLSKLKLSKARNFHQGARNARVWASSLTSVSLGKASSSRVPPSGDLWVQAGCSHLNIRTQTTDLDHWNQLLKPCRFCLFIPLLLVSYCCGSAKSFVFRKNIYCCALELEEYSSQCKFEKGCFPVYINMVTEGNLTCKLVTLDWIWS